MYLSVRNWENAFDHVVRKSMFYWLNWNREQNFIFCLPSLVLICILLFCSYCIVCMCLTVFLLFRILFFETYALLLSHLYQWIYRNHSVYIFEHTWHELKVSNILQHWPPINSNSKEKKQVVGLYFICIYKRDCWKTPDVLLNILFSNC